jgi:hypothetical protein
MDSLMRAAIMAFGGVNARGKIGKAARRLTAAAGCAALAGICATASAGCAVAALWVFVLPRVGPVGAPLIAAAALLLLCLALLATSRVMLRRRPAPIASATLSGSTAPALLIAEATRLFGDNKGAALLAALLAGATAANLERP